jgi:hypothetical protein
VNQDSIMLVADAYRSAEWHDFFVMVGGGAAALTGLVFVAMSLNVKEITQDATHLYRAIGTLAGFAGAFSICALALMGRPNHVALGVEWLIVAIAAGGIYVHGYVGVIRGGGSSEGLKLNRLVGGSACYAAEAVGATLLIAGYIAGLYVAAAAMIVFFSFMISGAWLLIVGVHRSAASTSSSPRDV